MHLSPEDQPYVTPAWRSNYSAFLHEFEDGIGEDFLVKLWERGGFFVGDLALATYERIFCFEHFGEEATRRLLDEPDLQVVTWHRDGYDLDPTSLHHLYHLGFWEQQTHKDLRDLNSVIEWGGGYGSLARICKKRNPHLDYLIVDLPLLSAIQKRYLAASHMTVKHRRPSEMMDRGLTADLFVATWSLDESSRDAQRLVRSTNYFRAPHILLAYHPDKADFPDSAGFTIPDGSASFKAPSADSLYAFR